MRTRRRATLSISVEPVGVTIVTPILPLGTDSAAAQRHLLDRYIEQNGLHDFIAWYYTPMALTFSEHLEPRLTIYDCMDELSAFDGAPTEMTEQETRLLGRADLVFTGGMSLYESKKDRHANVHSFPSSIDHHHFGAARSNLADPQDQKHIPRPRIGFFGVLDERLDTALLRELAALRPDWNLILAGPVAKIREEDLPRAKNIHYLGPKAYRDLPSYLANWDVAMLPFARNRSTRFISPTKTPEYLSGGKPVVATPIKDVVAGYGELGVIRIAENAEEFAAAISASLGAISPEWLAQVDALLAQTSWDRTFAGMLDLVIRSKAGSAVPPPSTTIDRSQQSV